MSLYLISDTHFDHENIIEYCNRPFESASEMDSQLKYGWNKRVQGEDTVLHGGDIAMARGDVAIEYTNQLNGSIVLLDGNHDDIDQSEAPFPVMKSYYFTYIYEGTEYEFYYTHWPMGTDHHGEQNWPHYAEPPSWFNGWYLHGHVHNNDPENFPFVDSDKNYVNLSVELTGYTPLHIEELIEILKNNQRYTTINDVPGKNKPSLVKPPTLQN